MSILYTWIRWFSLDTVSCVVIIQLFLGQFTQIYTVGMLVGLCCAVSLVYMLDRYRDLHLAVGVNGRHQVYKGKDVLVIISGLGLAAGAFFYWFALGVVDKYVILSCTGVVGIHLWLLSFKAYSRIKDLVVACVFTVVMMLGRFELTSITIVIGLYSLLNLRCHRFIEIGMNKKDYVQLALLSCVIIVLVSTIGIIKADAWLWAIACFGHMMIAYIGKKNRYWYEAGEAVYILPFLAPFI